MEKLQIHVYALIWHFKKWLTEMFVRPGVWFSRVWVSKRHPNTLLAKNMNCNTLWAFCHRSDNPWSLVDTFYIFWGKSWLLHVTILAADYVQNNNTQRKTLLFRKVFFRLYGPLTFLQKAHVWKGEGALYQIAIIIIIIINNELYSSTVFEDLLASWVIRDICTST